MKKIAILGSTGSIGIQTIEVCLANPEKFNIVALSGNKNYQLLIKQALKIRPKYVVVTNKYSYEKVLEGLKDSKISVLPGEMLNEIVKLPEIDLIVNALVGFAGLLPTYFAIKNKKTVALANKEALVVGGKIITKIVKENNLQIIPIDSEHSAIFQTLQGEKKENIEKIILTASGGPFRDYSLEQLKNVQVEQALKHPNWVMGGKITIDSATLMNKGLEMIEAKWLFDLEPKQIDVIIHKQSIIHSLVEFIDGSIKAQLGLPDMRLPIQYALSYPDRIATKFERFSFEKYPLLTFEKVREDVFKCIKIAKNALEIGENIPCIMNAANEVAVEMFLQKRISFLDIANIVEKTLEYFSVEEVKEIEQLLEFDIKAREIAQNIIKKES